MQKDIIQKIDLLVEMSDTNNHYDTLKEELGVLESDIAAKKIQVNRLKKAMETNRYLNASDRIIDENIKIGLENKLDGYEKNLNDILFEIENVSKEEEEYHQMILELEDEISVSQHFLEALNLKIKTIGSKDKSVYTFYEDLIDSTNKEIESNKTRLRVKQKAYEQVQSRLESFGEERFQLEEKIKVDTQKLEDTKTVLNTPDAYLDKSAQAKDEETLKNLEESLEKLEKRRLEIITDPAYIGHDAIDLLVSDDRTSALLKVKELVTIVNSKPYMDFRYEELDEILEDAIQKRDEFSNSIEGKKYDGMDQSVVEERTLFLQEYKELKEKDKADLEVKIRHMDVDLVQKLMQLITNAKQKRDHLKEDIEQYKMVMEENNDYKSPKKKASLNAAFHRKCDELEQVNQIIASYERDLEKIVEDSKNLEEKELSLLNETLKDIDQEIQTYKKRKMFENSTKDILAIEKDKNELKKLSDEVSKIEHRKKYMKTPNDIFEEIEFAFSTDTSFDEPAVEEETVNLNDYRIHVEDEDSSFDDASTKEEPALVSEEVQEPPLPEEEEEPVSLPESVLVEPVNSLDEILPPVEEENEEEFSFPPRNLSSDNNSKLFKVIRVEPLDENSNEKEEDTAVEKLEPESLDDTDMYMVNDMEDTDYISFNDLLEGNGNDGD